MPYRQSEQAKPKVRGRTAPVLDELVRQFSDRYAFLRELVQNAIDAGATRVRVGVTRDGDDRTTFVEDDGAGMSLEIIKGPFLTKFSSSKEGDDSKIGRYGVGFLSVFALAPRLVAVDTETTDAAFAIELDPTFSYRVSTRPPIGRKGTRVAIIESSAGTSDSDHEALVERSLLRWCRFARIAIEIEVAGQTRSLSRPLALSAPVVLEEERDGMRVVVGPTPGTHLLPGLEKAEDSSDFAGFYCRGLTLVEATAGPHVLRGLRYRVECPQLAHTISRDDVVRNSAYQQALRLVQELADEQIRPSLERALRSAAEECAQRGVIDSRLPALIFAGQSLLRDERVVVPSVGPGAGAVPLSKVSARAPGNGPLVEELCRRGGTVALDPTLSAAWLPASLMTPERLLWHVVATPSEGNALASTLLRVLDRLDLRIERVLVSDATDRDGRASRIVASSELRRFADGSLHLFFPTQAKGGDTLVLFVHEPALEAALRLAPERAALLVARLVWLEQRGELPRRANLDLLDESRAHWGKA